MCIVASFVHTLYFIVVKPVYNIRLLDDTQWQISGIQEIIDIVQLHCNFNINKIPTI